MTTVAWILLGLLIVCFVIIVPVVYFASKQIINEYKGDVEHDG